MAWGNNVGLNDFSEVVLDLKLLGQYQNPLITASGIHQNQENFPSSMVDAATTTNLEPPFMDAAAGDFHLTGNSTAWLGITSTPPFDAFDVASDLEGTSRNPFEPTKGCYERN